MHSSIISANSYKHTKVVYCVHPSDSEHTLHGFTAAQIAMIKTSYIEWDTVVVAVVKLWIRQEMQCPFLIHRKGVVLQPVIPKILKGIFRGSGNRWRVVLFIHCMTYGSTHWSSILLSSVTKGADFPQRSHCITGGVLGECAPLAVDWMAVNVNGISGLRLRSVTRSSRGQ